jgi:N-acetylmuramic acid 6-phosphate etherase
MGRLGGALNLFSLFGTLCDVISKKIYSGLPTEQNNPLSAGIDQLPTLSILLLINKEDTTVPTAVRQTLPEMEKAVNLIVKSLKNNGRLFLLGAGTSGRLAVMEAAECPPTFNTPPTLVQAFMAGGNSSVFKSKEGAEDRGQDSARIVKKHVTSRDVVIGIAASGVTAFVGDGLRQARRQNAATILITCNPKVSPTLAQVAIRLNTGAEVIAGSTRLKAATATKLVLNSLTVASMVQLGKVYGNRMVDLQPRSKKLEARALNLIETLGGVTETQAKKLMKDSGGNAKTAILMAKRNVSRTDAIALLKKSNGKLAEALKAISPPLVGGVRGGV